MPNHPRTSRVRSTVLAGATMAVVVSGCSSTPVASGAADYPATVEIRIPSDVDAPEFAAEALSARLDAVDVPHAVETADGLLTAGFDPGDLLLDDAFFTAPGEITVRPLSDDAAADAASCESATLDVSCVAPDPAGGPELVLGPVAVPREAFAGASADDDGAGGAMVMLELTDEGAADMEALTAQAACATGAPHRIALLLDGVVVAAPAVAVGCGNSLRSPIALAGGFTADEAAVMAALVSGAGIPAGTELVSRT